MPRGPEPVRVVIANPSRGGRHPGCRGSGDPGVRPGPQTEHYLAKILSRITFPGALFIAAVALIPSWALTTFLPGQQVSFSGISILIAVGVALETMKQIDSQLMMRNYEGFLK